MIGIIDTGICNLSSLLNCLKHLLIKFISSKNSRELYECDKLILPGVGTFKKGMDSLKKNNFIKLINEHCFKKKPLLGICLGMQLFMKEGYENGFNHGLALINGTVLKLQKNKKTRIPHIGWNDLNEIESKNSLLINIKPKSNFYFIHSYAVHLNEKINFCTTSHGTNKFISVFQKNNIYGVQFHPEKSQKNGLKILRNFHNL